MEEEKALTIGTEIDVALKTKGGLIPENLDQLWRLAVMMTKSGMMPKGIQTPEAVAVAVPVSDGSVDSSHSTVTSAGQEITGAVVSTTVTVWVAVAELLDASVAVQIRVSM